MPPFGLATAMTVPAAERTFSRYRLPTALRRLPTFPGVTGKRSDTNDQTQRRTVPRGPDWIAGHNNARTLVAIDLIGHDVLFVHNGAAREAAEREVAGALVNGHDLRRISEERGVSIETARSQLKAVFRKTGAPSQNDLIRLAVKANPPIRGGTPKQGQD